MFINLSCALFMFVALGLFVALPATAAPLAGLHYLVGTWKCTYRAGVERLTYDATYTYERDGVLRQTDASAVGDDEELLGYGAKGGGWTAVVFDGQGNTTVMRARGSDPNHIAYRSVYPDANLAVTFDRISSTKYTLHGTMRTGTKTFTNVDTCLRGTP